MRDPIQYSTGERFWLAALGVCGFTLVNGAFLYGLLFQPDALAAASSGRPARNDLRG